MMQQSNSTSEFLQMFREDVDWLDYKPEQDPYLCTEELMYNSLFGQNVSGEELALRDKIKSFNIREYFGYKLKDEVEELGLKLTDDSQAEWSISYYTRITPSDFNEGMEFHHGSALAYDVYIRCNEMRQIEWVDFKILECRCGQSPSFSPYNVPIQMVPSSVTFDIPWIFIVPACKSKVIALFDEIIA